MRNWQQDRRIFSLRTAAAIAVLFAAVLLLTIGKNYFKPKVSKGQPVPAPTALDPNFLNQVNECFIPTAAAYGYTLRITSGFRSLDDQIQVFVQGRTENGHIVSEAPPGHSIHNYGFAVDVVDRWRGYNIDWAKLGKIGTYCGLEQGPDGDTEHFEYRGGLSTTDFQTGLRPPPLVLPCALMDQRAKAGQPLTKQDLQNCGAPKF